MTDNITLPRSVVEQALEALDESYADTRQGRALADALRAALEQPPTTEQSSVVQPQANQPAMTPIAQRKLDDLVASGYTISGYSIYHERKHQHGFVTGAGLVGWWKPDGVEYPQPRCEQESVAWMREDGKLALNDGGMFSSNWKPLYTHPQNLNCKSNQARLATLWGYVKEQPPRQPLTVGQINRLIADGKLPLSGNPYEVARAIERAHGIGGEK